MAQSNTDQVGKGVGRRQYIKECELSMENLRKEEKVNFFKVRATPGVANSEFSFLTMGTGLILAGSRRVLNLV